MRQTGDKMSGSTSRRKGHQFERDVANRLKPIYPDAKRGVLQCRSGSEVADVENTPWWIECKCGARPNVMGAYEQAVEAAGEDPRPIAVVSHKDRGRLLVTMAFDSWERLIKGQCKCKEHTQCTKI